MKDYYIEIKTTYKNLEYAQKTATFLVKKRLVACAQFYEIKSCYSFDNKIVNDTEILLTLKIKKSLYHKIKKAIIRKHEYKTPQITTHKIDDGLDSYLEWIDSSTQ